MKKQYFLFVCLLFLTGCCGYRFSRGELPACYQSISVPYAEGDWDGHLTSAVIARLASSGAFRYQPECGDLVLKIKLIDFRDKNIGFRYDRNREGCILPALIPTETRFSAIAEVCVIERERGCVVLGPLRIRASVDFDHDAYSSRDGVNVFSLGQLTDRDAALEAAHHPLNQELAQKIADYVSSCW